MFVPRTAPEITETFMAKVVGRADVDDTHEGSLIRAIATTTGESLAQVEFRMLQIRNAFDITKPNITKVDFLERLKELPGNFGGGLLPANNASGSVMYFSRKAIIAQQTMVAGAIVGRNDGSGLTYVTAVDVVFPIGTATMKDVQITCQTPGTKGNCGTGIITRGINTPDWIISVANAAGLSNGFDEETVVACQDRVKLYLASFAYGCQAAGILFKAKSFTSSDGTRAKFAKLFRDPFKDYSELIVDDGSGFASLEQAAPATSWTVPTGEQTMLVHPGPATAEFFEIIVEKGGDPNNAVHLTQDGGQIKSVFEEGYVFVPAKKSWSLQATDIVYAPAFNVYVGYIAELQRALDGDVNDPFNNPGQTAFGCRIAVGRPIVKYVPLRFHVVPINGVDVAQVNAQALNLAVIYMDNLGPGEPLVIFQLNAFISQSADIENLFIFEPASATGALKQDVYAQDKQVLRTGSPYISFTQGGLT